MIGIVGLWLSAGFLWESWAHLHVGVESFFTPYHAVFYSAMLVGAGVMGSAALRNRRLGYARNRLLPAAYRQALLGVPIFFLGGVGDFIWHSFFGVENRIEAVTSPTHLIIGFGVVLVLSAPIRSALGARAELHSLRDELPLLFSLAACLEFVHLGTSYAFDPSAGRLDAPPNGSNFSADYFTANAIVLYKTGSGVMIVILTSLIEMAFAIWLATRFSLKFGAMTLFFVLGDGMIAAALTNTRPLLVIHLIMALVAGIVADISIARLRPSRSDSGLRIFGLVVPLAYYGSFFAATLALEGTWWNWSLIGGAIVWSALAGVALTMLVPSRNNRAEAPFVFTSLPAARKLVRSAKRAGRLSS
ncbi:MAG: hypothetical protein IAI50_05890 [Candidatus Eremiobacteraeota bacterium]|nr:hypothetical protein [Candidatus Eremiobacteraeota bacterium]